MRTTQRTQVVSGLIVLYLALVGVLVALAAPQASALAKTSAETERADRMVGSAVPDRILGHPAPTESTVAQGTTSSPAGWAGIESVVDRATIGSTPVPAATQAPAAAGTTACARCAVKTVSSTAGRVATCAWSAHSIAPRSGGVRRPG